MTHAAAVVLGRVGGASVGLALGGAPGALAGAASGPLFTAVLEKVGAEVSQRLLSPRELSRVGAVYLLAADETRARLDAGEVARDDGFFAEGPEGRSSAEEITEGVFLAAQREYEERKLPYLANLLSGLGFDASIDRPHAVAQLHLAQSLTYHQLCLIAYCRRLTGLVEAPVVLNSSEPEQTEESEFLMAQMAELASRRLTAAQGTFGGGQIFLGQGDAGRLTREGERLHTLMQLERIPSVDVDLVVAGLGRPAMANQKEGEETPPGPPSAPLSWHARDDGAR
jgi:hypothetical protein